MSRRRVRKIRMVIHAEWGIPAGKVATKEEMLKHIKDVAGGDTEDGFSKKATLFVEDDKEEEMNKKTLRGYVGPFAETGSEGICWQFYEDNKTWPNCMHELDDGDHLKVLGEKGETLFEGEIEKEFRANRGEDKKHERLYALGHRIHWVQKGWEPDDWAELFLYQHLVGNEEKNPLRAELTKKK